MTTDSLVDEIQLIAGPERTTFSLPSGMGPAQKKDPPPKEKRKVFSQEIKRVTIRREPIRLTEEKLINIVFVLL